MTASTSTLTGLTTGTWTIDTEVGLRARHLVVTKVAAPSPTSGDRRGGRRHLSSRRHVTIATTSVTTSTADRDGHLRSSYADVRPSR